MTISILAEPRFRILHAEPARAETATDEDGKSLGASKLAPNPWSTLLRELAWKDFEQTTNVLLQRSSEKARKIKMLRGTIPVHVVSERKRVVFTDNVLKAKGSKCRVREGVLEITKAIEKNGDLHIHITVPVEPEGVRWRWYQRVHLEDPKGNLYTPYNQGTTSTGGSPREVIELTYNISQDPKVGPPSKLVVEDWTTLHYAIPFEFKDVPLP